MQSCVCQLLSAAPTRAVIQNLTPGGLAERLSVSPGCLKSYDHIIQSELESKTSFSTVLSQVSEHRPAGGRQQSGQCADFKDPHQHGATGSQRLEAVGPFPTSQRTARDAGLQNHYRKTAGTCLVSHPYTPPQGQTGSNMSRNVTHCLEEH